MLIVGLGKSGKAAFEYCVPFLGERIQSITVYAGSDADSRAFVAENRLEHVTFCFDEEEFSSAFDLGIISPGISEFSPLYQNAKQACDELIGEVEFAWRESSVDSRWVAITGTNGKTTTTALTAHLLQAGGLRANAVGNIGDACIEAVQAGTTDVYVAEVSSYQLASTKRFAPDVAVLLNITPDHLAWHKSMEAYVAAKQQLFANLNENSQAILSTTLLSQESREAAKASSNPPIFQITQSPSLSPHTPLSPHEVGSSRVSTTEWTTGQVSPAGQSPQPIKQAPPENQNAAWVENDTLKVAFNNATHDVGPTAALQIKGSHNIENSLAAASVAVVFQINDQIIREALASFAPLEHRIEPCGTIAGVNFYNDSKATNVDAVIKALTAFDLSHLVLLLGGHDKGTDLADLAQAVQPCKTIVCFGAAAPRFYDELIKGGVPRKKCYLAASLKEALDQARLHASPGDDILLSPACASFDEFGSFEQRGKAFKDLVATASEEG